MYTRSRPERRLEVLRPAGRMNRVGLWAQVTELLRARPEGSTQYTELPECGHVPMQEQPGAFVAAVAPFLREVVGSTAASSSAALG